MDRKTQTEFRSLNFEEKWNNINTKKRTLPTWASVLRILFTDLEIRTVLCSVIKTLPQAIAPQYFQLNGHILGFRLQTQKLKRLNV